MMPVHSSGLHKLGSQYQAAPRRPSTPCGLGTAGTIPRPPKSPSSWTSRTPLTLDRNAVLSVTQKHFPALARWATWCYCRPTRLQFAEWVVDSCTGVQQGDPLGPLLFAAALQPLAQDLRAAGLDVAVHYLDDGVLAGDVPAVSAALRLVETQAASIGLHLNLAKSELVAVGAVDVAALHCHFPDALLRDRRDGSCRVRRNFELLGAAIGDDEFIHAHTAERAAKAGDLLDALGELEDPQVGLRLLRASAGFARMLHSMRCNPPTPQMAGLQMFDGMVRRSFGDFTGLHPTSSQWQQAALGLAHGGLGLRSTADHAPAAFLASWASTLPSAGELDVTFQVDEATQCRHVTAAFASFSMAVGPGTVMDMDMVLTSKQRKLSDLLDSASWHGHLGQAGVTEKATLLSEASLGGRAFLNAVPAGKTRMEPALFISELRARLQIPDAESDSWCPLCDTVMDCHNHHAGMCVAGGERSQRHHAVRDIVNAWAHRGGLRPERERPGLLLPQSPDDVSSARRRPADVYLPAFAGSPAALDFAITAPQRQETLAQASHIPLAAAAAYARHKESHLQTAQSCQAQGVRFIPMVAENTGAWGPPAEIVLKHIAKAVAARSGADPASS